MKIGVFLSRMQPLHIGHLGIIETILEENDRLIILIGSKNKCGTIRNPLDISIRREILEETLSEKYGQDYQKRITIIELPDWSMETDTSSNQEWGRYLYYNIVSRAEQKNFSIYFSDSPEIIKGWFDDELIERINFRLFERKNMFQGVSSTQVREAFLNNDREYIEKSCPNAVLKRYQELERIIKEVQKNPKKDYEIE